MGQDSEQAAEFVATVRGEHVAMKTWYMGSSSPAAQALQQQYGPYPDLWKQVLNWPGWKETRKEYLKAQQQQSSSVEDHNPSFSDHNNSYNNQPDNNNNHVEAPRKRKSRWGSAVANQDGGHNDNNNNNGNDPNRATASQNNNNANGPRRSRWSSTTPAPGVPNLAVPAKLPGLPGMMHHPPGPGLPLPPVPSSSSLPPAPPTALPLPLLPGMPAGLSPAQQEEMRRLQNRLRQINDQMERLDEEAARVDALPRGDPQRSPSPPPIYGADGKRKNTRAVRWRERYTAERQELLEKIMNMNPATRRSNLLVRKRFRKIRIPIEEHPNYNFIGLIIGPRGKTQKELESKTGCKIAIRGRGSVKEGARGRRDGKIMEGDDEPLHVVISGDDQKAVDAASDMIEQMLIVIDDEKNVHKQQQLRELALLNGTLKEDEFCPICAEKGHRAFECPRRFAMNKKPALQVKCAICGDTSHPTRDCTQKQVAPLEQKDQQAFDSDYMSFMAELDGKKAEKPAVVAPPASVTVDESASGPPTKAPGGPLPSDPSSLPLPPPPPPVLGIPPPIGLLPPPGAPAATVPAPPVPLPVPPLSAVPPPPTAYYGQPAPPGFGPYGHAGAYPPAAIPTPQQQSQHPYYHQHQSMPPSAQQAPSGQQVRPGEETMNWDPSNYYGGGGGTAAFNWWDQQ